MTKTFLLIIAAITAVLFAGCEAGSQKTAQQQEQLDWFGNWVLNYASTLRELPATLQDIEKMEQEVR